MIIALTLLVALIGLLVYVLIKENPKLEELGRLMFFAGLLAFLLTGAQKAIDLMK